MIRPRFCYVLTTDGRDVHADMTYVSAAFAREAHPGAEIVVLCDEPSRLALEMAVHPLCELANRVQGVVTPSGAPPAHRNRFVKTRMRQTLEGDFIYLDADAVVVNRMDELIHCPACVAGVPNYNGSGGRDEITAPEVAIFEQMGWSLPTRPYINGGVVLMRDTDATHRFANLWHEKWLAWSRFGRHNDQQALNSALNDSGVDYVVVGDHLNAQVASYPGPADIKGSVWHFYVSRYDITWTILGRALDLFRRGELTPEAVREFQSWRFPWRSETALDEWFIRRGIISRSIHNPGSAEYLWVTGHRCAAIRVLGRRTIRRGGSGIVRRLRSSVAGRGKLVGLRRS